MVGGFFHAPTARTLGAKMAWKTLADAAISATLVSVSLLGAILIGMPFFLVLAALLTGILGA